MCAQQRLRSAWASAQSDQSLRCPHEESLGPYLPIECTVKTLIRLGGCPGWFESWLGAQVILLVLSWGSSVMSQIHVLFFFFQFDQCSKMICILRACFQIDRTVWDPKKNIVITVFLAIWMGSSSWKLLCIKVTPDLHLTYRKNGGNLGLVLKMKNIACISILLTTHVKYTYLYLFKFVFYGIVAFKVN